MSMNQPFQNKILASLSSSEYERIFIDLQFVKVYRSEVLYDSGEFPHSVFFPINCSISLLYKTESDSNAEVITIGNESAVGTDMIISNQAMPYTAIGRNPGHAYRLPKESFMDEFNRRGSLYQKVLGYTLTLPDQTEPGTVFSPHHKINP